MGNSVATGMVNVFRDYGEVVQGAALSPVVFIKVRWAWLSYLAAQILLTIVFLVAVIVRSALLGIDVVKSSAMATLFAMEQSSDSEQDGIVLPGLRRDVDKRTTGRLRRYHKTWSMVVERTDNARK
ncbi:hypothetical protein CC79DRAFT_1325230 [Sarocladium strictum]